MDFAAMREQGVLNALACVGMGYSQPQRLATNKRDCSSLTARAMIQADYEYGCPGKPVPLSYQQPYEDGFELIYPASYDLIGKSLPSSKSVLKNAGLQRGDVMFVGWPSSNRPNNIEHVTMLIDGENIVHARGKAYGVRKDKASIYADKVAAITRFNPSCDLVMGHKGNRVRKLQKALNAKMNAGLTVDGDFGKATRAALLKFQAADTSLLVNGKGDVATRHALGIMEDFSAVMPTLKVGMSGEWVRLMQTLLIAAGENLTVTGTFDYATQNALTYYQMSQGLAVDCVCGPVTWDHLEMAYDDDGVSDGVVPTDEWRVKVMGASVNLRDKPSTLQGKQRALVYKGAVLKATGIQMDGWFNVIYNNESLWISGNKGLSTLYAYNGEDPVPSPIDPKRVNITDLSKWNGKNYQFTDYKGVVLFQILRISCGLNKDSVVDWMLQKAKENNIPTYVYMYTLADNVAEITAETKKMLEYLAPYKDFVLGTFLDAEISSVTRAMGNAFVDTCRAAGVKRVGFYIAHHLYRKMNLDVSKVDIIWIPNYGKNNGSVSSKPLYFCHLHQFTSRGKVKGCGDTTIDLSRIMPDCGKTPEWFVTPEAA